MKKLIIVASLLISVFMISCKGQFCSETRVANLTVGEGFVNPIGYSLEDLSFSWQMQSSKAGAKQSAYRIRVATSPEKLNTPDVWDSGKVVSSDSVAVAYKGRNIKSREKLWWDVIVWDENGKELEPSSVASFEAGLLDNSEWKGKWITAEFEPNVYREVNFSHLKSSKLYPFYSPVYLRKDFSAKGKEIKSARLYMTARGVYVAYLNGKKLGNDFLSPGWTDYNKRIQTTTYDVSNLISKNNNTLGAIIADGWYAGRLGWLLGKNRGNYGVFPELLAQLEITYKDGTKDIVVSDSSWKAGLGGVLNSDLYDGEDFDARREPKGWNSPAFDDSNWKTPLTKNVEKTPLLQPRRSQPIVITQTLKAKSVKEISAGTYIFDLGQNMIGWAKINIDGKAGQKIKIRFAEMLKQDGTMYTENYRSARSIDNYICAGGKAQWEPNFTFHGFRYVELSGLPSGLKLPLDTVEGRVLHNDMKITGSFSCSEPKINQLQSNIQWGQRSNFLSIPTDCPQRDERLGWTGDIQVFCPTAVYNMNVNAFMTKWLVDLEDAQISCGATPKYAPVLKDKKPGGPAWGDAATVCPWEVYLAFGNKKILRQTFDMMKRHVEQSVAMSENFVYPEYGYGDWLEPFVKERRGTTPRKLIGTAFIVRSADITARVAKILGKDADAKKYADIREKAKQAFIKNFVNTQTGEITSNNQTAYLVALAFDILPENLRLKSFAKLQDAIKKKNNHLGTGFVGTPMLTSVLSRFGDDATAQKLLKNETFPSWLYPINQGATTMWERWNSYTHKDGFGDVSMNSFNHYAYGAIGKWMYSTLAGIAPDEKNAGYKNIIFTPRPDMAMGFVNATLDSPYGKISSSWKNNQGNLSWEIVIPPNSTGTIVFPSKDTAKISLDGKAIAKDLPRDSLGYPVIENVESGTHNIEIKK